MVLDTRWEAMPATLDVLLSFWYNSQSDLWGGGSPGHLLTHTPTSPVLDEQTLSGIHGWGLSRRSSRIFFG